MLGLAVFFSLQKFIWRECVEFYFSLNFGLGFHYLYFPIVGLSGNEILHECFLFLKIMSDKSCMCVLLSSA